VGGEGGGGGAQGANLPKMERGHEREGGDGVENQLKSARIPFSLGTLFLLSLQRRFPSSEGEPGPVFEQGLDNTR